jgi:hypothetical protein
VSREGLGYREFKPLPQHKLARLAVLSGCRSGHGVSSIDPLHVIMHGNTVKLLYIRARRTLHIEACGLP